MIGQTLGFMVCFLVFLDVDITKQAAGVLVRLPAMVTGVFEAYSVLAPHTLGLYHWNKTAGTSARGLRPT